MILILRAVSEDIQSHRKTKQVVWNQSRYHRLIPIYRWRHGESVPEEERLSASAAGGENMESSIMDESISKSATTTATTKGKKNSFGAYFSFMTFYHFCLDVQSFIFHISYLVKCV